MEGKNTLEGTKYVPGAVKKIARNISDYRPVIFTVMGDAPYGKKERQRMPEQIARIPRNTEFVVHVGDIKSTDIDCKSEAYSSAAAMFKESSRPFYIVPGDNDWYDCDKPMDAWNLWKESFLNFDNNWNKNYEVNYQKDRRENFSFLKRSVLFLGVHIIGGRGKHKTMKDRKEWNLRIKDNISWMAGELKRFSTNRKVGAVVIFGHAFPNAHHYRPYFDEISRLANEYDIPFLYIQGDEHSWRKDRPFKSDKILRVVVDRGGIADPVQVTVDLRREDVFSFERRTLVKHALRGS
mmetsp:Transcript_20779/g.30426  ORF Transcript_20779/g.30426 Transcript_20779/m.30426 type:complete len:294 (+) Transcript_20779:559-1440(+)